jgi:ribosomal protein S27AE
MEPIRDAPVTLVDLLDRILDKGLVINADVIISVAGIPLIGVNLRAALAGMETMLKYGVMQAWDEKTRRWEREHRKRQEVSLFKGEEVTSRIFGSYFYSKGIYTSWRLGQIYLTDKRLFLWNGELAEIVFQILLENIKAILISQKDPFISKKKEVLHLLDRDNRVYRLHALEAGRLKEAIEHNLEAAGLSLEEKTILPESEREPMSFLMERERITNRGKMWHLVPVEGILEKTWKPGCLYLTNKRLCWWCDFEHKIVFEIPIKDISMAAKDRRNLSPVLKDKKLLDVIYTVNGTKAVTSFSGKEIDEWDKVLNKAINKVSQHEDEKETCPRCQILAPAKELLERGCSKCGWVSLRQIEKIKVEN